MFIAGALEATGVALRPSVNLDIGTERIETELSSYAR